MQTKNYLILIFIFTLFSTCLLAQKFDRPNGFGGQILILDHASLQEDNDFGFGNLTTGFEFSYSRHFNRFLSLRVPFKGGIISAEELEFAKNRSFIGLDLTLQVSYFGNENKIAPFVYTGFGATREESQDIYNQIPVGAGLNFRIGPWGFFQVKAEYRADLRNELERTNLQYGIGLVAVVGPTATTEELEKLLSDTDGDGIDDEFDRCPDIAGRKQFGGCLDSDNDGIGDGDDSCPNDVGLKELNGCPDSDADGVADVVDLCPEVPGTANGCPDSDEDGVADVYDKCPDTPGVKGGDGCPILDIIDVVAEVDPEDDMTSKGALESDTDAEVLDSDGNENNTSSSEDSVYSNNDNSNYSNSDYSNSYNNDGYSNPAPNSVISNKAHTLMADATKIVQFNTLSDDLTQSSYHVLDEIVQLMIENPNFRLKVAGHADIRGEDSVNQRLSEKRARACVRYLRDQGVPEMQMSYIGYGARIPVSDNDSEFGRSQNRRVEFELYIVN